MMDTDKKRKTIRCQKCGLTFSGERVYCPLCKKRIIDEGTADSSIKEDFDVFPVTQKKQADFIFMKIVTFAALAAVIVAGMVDRIMVLSWLEGLERTDCSSAYSSWHEFIIFYSWICGQKAPDRLWNLFFADYYRNSSCCNACLCWSYA